MQHHLMASAGLEIVETDGWLRSQFTTTRISAKLVDDIPVDIEVVTCFVGKRPVD
jgi:hypothetical protein